MKHIHVHQEWERARNGVPEGCRGKIKIRKKKQKTRRNSYTMVRTKQEEEDEEEGGKNPRENAAESRPWL